MQSYEADRDYTDYVVGDQDLPLVSTAQAAATLKRTPETVRNLIKTGRLPARRSGVGYNPRYEIPLWAVEGRVSRGDVRLGVPSPPMAASISVEAHSTAERMARLENALIALRLAREHERRAQELQSSAVSELRAANEVLSAALSGGVLPDLPPAG